MIEYTTREVSDSVIVVRADRPLTDANRKYFFDCIGEMIVSGAQYVIIECQRIGHLNSEALSCLLTARKQVAQKGGRIYLTHLSSSIVEVMEMTKLGKLLAVFSTTQAALEDIQSDPACVG